MIDVSPLQIIQLVCLIVAVMIHEVAHAFVALLCGDTTARDAGRISLNPIRHIDPIGTILLPLILAVTNAGIMFGWAKPVPINILRCRNPRQALWLTAIAGPISNLIQALLAVGVFHLLLQQIPASGIPLVLEYGIQSCVIFALINIVLMTFNLIPIPPLDGSRIVVTLLPERLAVPYMKLEQFGFLILIVLLNLDVFNGLIGNTIKGFFKLAGISN